MHSTIRSFVLGICSLVMCTSIALASDTDKSEQRQDTDLTPQGMLAFFLQTGCPDGWSVAEYASGRVLVAITDLDRYNLLGTVGEPMANATAPVHTHDYHTTLSVNKKSIAAANGSNRQGGGSGDYNVPRDNDGLTEGSDSGMAYIQLTICEKQ